MANFLSLDIAASCLNSARGGHQKLFSCLRWSTLRFQEQAIHLSQSQSDSKMRADPKQ